MKVRITWSDYSSKVYEGESMSKVAAKVRNYKKYIIIKTEEVKDEKPAEPGK
jgi:hypothetical protein